MSWDHWPFRLPHLHLLFYILCKKRRTYVPSWFQLHHPSDLYQRRWQGLTLILKLLVSILIFPAHYCGPAPQHRQRSLSNGTMIYIFKPFRVHTLGLWGPGALNREDLADRLTETAWMEQRGNAASILSILPSGDCMDRLGYKTDLFLIDYSS